MFSKLIYENIDEGQYMLIEPLQYRSELLGSTVIVPMKFVFDNESIWRVPFLYAWLGRTSDRAGCLHDYLYRSGSRPPVDRKTADRVYREANKVRNIGWFARNVKYWGVRLFGYWSYHKRTVFG